MKRKSYDLAAIERDYRGEYSNLEIGRRHGISEGLVRRLAQKHGWERNLKKRIRQRAEVLLAQQDAQSVTDDEIIDHGAHSRVEILRVQRDDIRNARGAARELMAQLQEQNGAVEALTQAIMRETKDDKSSKRREALMGAVSLPSRAQTLDKLVGALERLIRLERQSYGLDEREEEDSYEERLRHLMGV